VINIVQSVLIPVLYLVQPKSIIKKFLLALVAAIMALGFLFYNSRDLSSIGLFYILGVAFSVNQYFWDLLGSYTELNKEFNTLSLIDSRSARQFFNLGFSLIPIVYSFVMAGYVSSDLSVELILSGLSGLGAIFCFILLIFSPNSNIENANTDQEVSADLENSESFTDSSYVIVSKKAVIAKALSLEGMIKIKSPIIKSSDAKPLLYCVDSDDGGPTPPGKTIPISVGKNMNVPTLGSLAKANGVIAKSTEISQSVGISSLRVETSEATSNKLSEKSGSPSRQKPALASPGRWIDRTKGVESTGSCSPQKDKSWKKRRDHESQFAGSSDIDQMSPKSNDKLGDLSSAKQIKSPPIANVKSSTVVNSLLVKISDVAAARPNGIDNAPASQPKDTPIKSSQPLKAKKHPIITPGSAIAKSPKLAAKGQDMAPIKPTISPNKTNQPQNKGIEAETKSFDVKTGSFDQLQTELYDKFPTGEFQTQQKFQRPPQILEPPVRSRATSEVDDVDIAMRMFRVGEQSIHSVSESMNGFRKQSSFEHQVIGPSRLFSKGPATGFFNHENKFDSDDSESIKSIE
jgi:hypothetical protein